MDKYTAVFGHHNGRIVSVGANSREDALGKVTEQLDRPGRRDTLVRWVHDGRKLIVNDDEATLTRDEGI